MTGDATKSLQERSGGNFDMALLLEARHHTRAIIGAIAASVTPGLLEEDALALTRRLLKESGMLRGWHGVHVRFGENTLKNFGEPSQPGTMLKPDDIFFIDIGPVWQNYEGDGGDTFVVGHDPEMHKAARDVRAIFDATRTAWRDRGLTGRALYAFAEDEAEQRGWQLNLDMAGHRLSDFPHAVHHRGGLSESDYLPSPGLWVLEIQIRHPDRSFSAFYEDLLLD